jgi:signal transduction histidine kinase
MTQHSTQEHGGLAVRVGSRTLGLEELAYVNRATTTGLVLPNVAHELNNALQVIGGLVELLSMRADLPQDAKDKIGRIGAQSGRATELIRELVTFARRDDAGLAQVDLAKLVDRALAFRRYHLARARIAVHVAGAQPGEVLVRADGSSLLQILLNLIINGEQALTGRAGAEIHVHIARTPEGVTVEVRDNGPGTGRHETAAPEPFFTTRPPAPGLGLAVATALAASQGGSLRLQSAPEGGSVAVLTVP